MLPPYRFTTSILKKIELSGSSCSSEWNSLFLQRVRRSPVLPPPPPSLSTINRGYSAGRHDHLALPVSRRRPAGLGPASHAPGRPNDLATFHYRYICMLHCTMYLCTHIHTLGRWSRVSPDGLWAGDTYNRIRYFLWLNTSDTRNALYSDNVIDLTIHQGTGSIPAHFLPLQVITVDLLRSQDMFK